MLRHHGWPVSPYSAKTRSYLRYKGIPFEEVQPTALQLNLRIQRAVGRMIMPTVLLDDGTWLQDTSDIIDTLDAAHPEPSITPPAPAQRVASALLELFADEWLPMAALHTRWNNPWNASFAVDEFARYGFPWLPRVVGRRLVQPMAGRMAGYRQVLGITDATVPAIEQTVTTLIAALEARLGQAPYLLGGRPCLGDFALYGPLWAHLYRDPGSTALFDGAPSVIAWMNRLTAGHHPPGAFEGGVPAALDPVFALIVEDMLPWVRTLIAAIDAWCAEHPDAKRVPRALGLASFTIRGVTDERKLVTFVSWKAQRVRAALDAAAGDPDPWLEPVRVAMPTIANPFARVRFKEVLASSVMR